MLASSRDLELLFVRDEDDFSFLDADEDDLLVSFFFFFSDRSESPCSFVCLLRFSFPPPDVSSPILSYLLLFPPLLSSLLLCLLELDRAREPRLLPTKDIPSTTSDVASFQYCACGWAIHPTVVLFCTCRA